MTLQTIWFILIFVLLGGYAILDGFDLGVGVLHLFARDERERRISINAIAPVWDGNEVWLLAGGGALFAAFPAVYATVFSGFYLALILLLVALIFRAVAMEFRGKVHSPTWRRAWDWAFGIGSLLPPVLLGTALGNVLQGVPLDMNGDYAGTFLQLLNPYAVLVGLFALVMFTTHGAIYLANKTDGRQREHVLAMAQPLWIGLAALHIIVGALTLWLTPHVMTGPIDLPLIFWPLMALLSAALICLPIWAFGKRPDYALALCASSAIIGSMVALTAVGLFPNLLPCSDFPSRSLTIINSSSSPQTLKTMLAIALIGMPLVIGYTAAIYRVFRGKVVLGEESY